MKIAVCIKRVPDTETRIKIAAGGKALDEAGVKYVLNPYDEYAVEEALRRKEQAGAGEVVIVCLGPAAAQETIRTALAMGADRGVLLQADGIPADGFAVAADASDDDVRALVPAAYAALGPEAGRHLFVGRPHAQDVLPREFPGLRLGPAAAEKLRD